MQKRAGLRAGRVAIGLTAAIALLVTLTVAGQILCAGMAGSGPPVVGHGPMTGGRGADGCVVSDAFAGPVKQQRFQRQGEAFRRRPPKRPSNGEVIYRGNETAFSSSRMA